MLVNFHASVPGIYRYFDRKRAGARRWEGGADTTERGNCPAPTGHTKGLCGDMFVRRDQRCRALCGASAANVNAPFFFSELRRPCAILAAAGSMHPNRLWPSQVWLAVQRFAAVQPFNVEFGHYPCVADAWIGVARPALFFATSARRTHARPRISSPNRGQ